MEIGLLVEGMKVAKPVVHDSGRILLMPGISLTGRLVEQLRGQGIGRVWVETEGPDEGALSAEAAKQMERTLERRFAHVRYDPLMQQLEAIVQKRIHSRAGDEAGQ
jgi:hypothetical protein